MSTTGTLPDQRGASPVMDPAAAREAARLWWPLERLGEGMEELARRAGLDPVSGDALVIPASLGASGAVDIGRWMDWAAERLGLEAEAVDATVPDFTEMLLTGGPAILACDDPRGLGFVLLLGSRMGHLRMIGPDLKVHRAQAELLRAAICWYIEAPLLPEIERLLDDAAVPSRRRPAVRAALLRERLSAERAGVCRVLRLPAGAGFWRQVSQARLPSRVRAMLAVFAVGYCLEFAGWGLIGDAALGGRLDMGWLAAWLLLMLSMIPLRLLGGWLDASFALEAGRILKSRLLAGALNLDIESVRRQGVGHLLGRVMESQALESLALNGGLGVLVALLELVFAAWILWLGAGAAYHLPLLAVWVLLTGWASWRYFGRLRDWTGARLAMTHDLIERMVGHRTRLAQERPDRRDAHEDQVMHAYLEVSKRFDQAALPISAGLPAGWMVAGLAGLLPAFVAGSTSAGTLAISLGGILVAQRALGGIAGGLSGLARAVIAWGQVAEMFNSAKKDDVPRPFLTSAQMGDAGGAAGRAKLIEASGLAFAYQPGGERVLQGVDLTLRHGERILLEGASGGGKSTLASLLAGLRGADAGLLLLNGLDRHTLGANWHRRATEAPQFHENHVLSGTLEFNLLMGREWPASESDLDEARALCEELGLGPLLERMPAGLMQRVGETGWQLSHGERSRIFLARALLQKAQLTIMDESFAALDPETLDKCLRCALRHANTLVVIAHP